MPHLPNPPRPQKNTENSKKWDWKPNWESELYISDSHCIVAKFHSYQKHSSYCADFVSPAQQYHSWICLFHCVEYLSRLAGSVIGAFPHHCDRPTFLLVHNSSLFTIPCGFPICFVHIRQHTGIISSDVMKHVTGQQSIPLCVSSSVLSNTT